MQLFYLGGHLRVGDRFFKACRRIEHFGQDVNIAYGVHEEPRTAEYPVDGRVDRLLIFQRPVPGSPRRYVWGR